MKLATLKEGGRDGTLVVVSHDLTRAVRAPDVAPTLQAALADWDVCAPRLRDMFHAIDQGRVAGDFAFDPAACAAPLPRAYQRCDGSAYVTHVELVRKARGAETPPSFWTDPLMRQGGSDGFLGPRDPIPLADESWGCDFESELAVVTGDVPMGATPEEARASIRLAMIVNDVSLRGFVPAELAKGFGFFQSKPTSAFSPVAVTPDSLGIGWDGAKMNLQLKTWLNDELFGHPNASVDMVFDFPTLIAHAAKTRDLSAGTIVGSGAASNRDRSFGASCIVERRALEQLEHGKPRTPYLKWGDRVRIEMIDPYDNSIFGAIDQRVEKPRPRG